MSRRDGEDVLGVATSARDTARGESGAMVIARCDLVDELRLDSLREGAADVALGTARGDWLSARSDDPARDDAPSAPRVDDAPRGV